MGFRSCFYRPLCQKQKRTDHFTGYLTSRNKKSQSPNIANDINTVGLHVLLTRFRVNIMV